MLTIRSDRRSGTDCSITSCWLLIENIILDNKNITLYNVNITLVNNSVILNNNSVTVNNVIISDDK